VPPAAAIPPIAVTGATGALGGRVGARLAERGLALRLVVREPSRAPELAGADVAQAEYRDGVAMRAALSGVHTLYLVSAGESADRVTEHVTAVDAALAAGVRRIVYTSFLAAAPDATFTFARDHFHTEEHIRATGAAYTFLRSSLYLDYVPVFCGADGVIRGPAGQGRVAAVARADIADVVTAVLTGDGHDGRTYDVTGREALTVAEMAAQLGRAAGRPVSYVAETLEEARASRAPSGAPAWEVEGWVTSYAAIATGEMDVVSDTVRRLAGHEPETLSEWLARNPESFAHLRAP
jgi:NAD(P)H dehydrogenase (quinone)